MDGCPWDREQTPETLKASLLEEAYESVDAIVQADDENLREELGDIYLLVTMIAYIKEQEGVFSVEDVFHEISDKLIRRHPHVFGDSDASTSEEIISQWDRIKTEVEGKPEKNSVLDTVKLSLPPLERAHKIQKKASKAGFDWEDIQPVRDKVQEELEECMAARETGNVQEIEEEIGDLLFSVVNLARFLHIDPTSALHRTNQKFIRRFKAVETEMKRRQHPMAKDKLEEMDAIWNAQKAQERGLTR